MSDPKHLTPSASPHLDCDECNGRGWHVGEHHPREECGACAGTGNVLSDGALQWLLEAFAPCKPATERNAVEKREMAREILRLRAQPMGQPSTFECGYPGCTTRDGVSLQAVCAHHAKWRDPPTANGLLALDPDEHKLVADARAAASRLILRVKGQVPEGRWPSLDDDITAIADACDELQRHLREQDMADGTDVLDQLCAALGWSRVPLADALTEVRLMREAHYEQGKDKP